MKTHTMKEKEPKKNTFIFAIINILCVLTLLIVVFPLLLIARYDYPSADDWSYGMYGYQALKAGGGLFQVLGASFRMVREAYLGWDGRFAAAFLDSLQPGIWGEQFYGVTPWILIGTLIFAELCFWRFLVSFTAEKGSNQWVWLPIIVPMLILQILFCPSPAQGFYWYTGSMNYTFVYSVSLVLAVLFMKLGMVESQSKWRKIVTAIIACLLAVIAGGANFSTSLSGFLGMCTLTVMFLIHRRKSFLYRTWFVTLTMGASLMLCLTAPGNVLGNANRISETGGAVKAVFLSLFRTATNICAWTAQGVVLLGIIFICPFICLAVKNMRYTFKLPLLFTLLSFGLYASQIVPTMYVEGTPGGGRQAVIIYYAYFMWLTANIFYWIGWLNRKTEKIRLLLDKAGERLGKFLVIYCGLVGLALVSVIYCFHLREITSYKAYRDWRQGWAQQYAVEWKARLEILHDDNIKEVEFAPLTVYPEMLEYTDLQDEAGYVWVNYTCAQYYNKISIDIVAPDN